MAKSVETLNLANATLVIEVSSIRADLANSSSHRANSHPDGRFYKTGYCWSHGYKVSKTHTSESCTKREMATRRRLTGVTTWGEVTGTRAGLSDRRGPTIITLN